MTPCSASPRPCRPPRWCWSPTPATVGPTPWSKPRRRPFLVSWPPNRYKIKATGRSSPRRRSACTVRCPDMAILMCPPDHFGVEYEINPWMNIHNEVDQPLARQQWKALYDAYQELGMVVDLVEPVR